MNRWLPADNPRCAAVPLPRARPSVRGARSHPGLRRQAMSPLRPCRACRVPVGTTLLTKAYRGSDSRPTLGGCRGSGPASGIDANGIGVGRIGLQPPAAPCLPVRRRASARISSASHARPAASRTSPFGQCAGDAAMRTSAHGRLERPTPRRALFPTLPGSGVDSGARRSSPCCPALEASASYHHAGGISLALAQHRAAKPGQQNPRSGDHERHRPGQVAAPVHP
jgi:hypothetical protein